jgi:hypothetical protein
VPSLCLGTCIFCISDPRNGEVIYKLYQINVDMQQIYYMNKFLFKETMI